MRTLKINFKNHFHQIEIKYFIFETSISFVRVYLEGRDNEGWFDKHKQNLEGFVFGFTFLMFWRRKKEHRLCSTVQREKELYEVD